MNTYVNYWISCLYLTGVLSNMNVIILRDRIICSPCIHERKLIPKLYWRYDHLSMLGFMLLEEVQGSGLYRCTFISLMPRAVAFRPFHAKWLYYRNWGHCLFVGKANVDKDGAHTVSISSIRSLTMYTIVCIWFHRHSDKSHQLTTPVDMEITWKSTFQTPLTQWCL